MLTRVFSLYIFQEYNTSQQQQQQCILITIKWGTLYYFLKREKIIPKKLIISAPEAQVAKVLKIISLQLIVLRK